MTEKLSQIKEANDIVEAISRHVPLKRSGKNYKALCPFHPDKEPSFYVNPERQTFKCFGCGVAGDVIAFVMKSEGFTFSDALKELARRAGIELRSESKSESRTSLILAANETAASFYQKMLFETSDGSAAREYLKKRGISEELSKKFRLGYAPDSWNSLLDHAASRGVKANIMIEAGLASEGKEGRPYDFFRNRLIFPIFDSTNKVIAFGGRVLDDSLPKYINTKETPLFRKSAVLYGFNFARQKVFDTRTLAVTEGYTDVMRAHEKGFAQLTATLGTSLTEEHARLIKRYADNVIVLFDADSAGKKATTRGVEVLLSESLNIKVAQLPAEKDLFDFLSKHPAEELEKVLASSEDIFDFSLRIAKGRHDIKTISGASAAINEMVALIRRIPDKQAVELAIDKVSLALGANRRDIAMRIEEQEPFLEFRRSSPTASSSHRDMDILDIVFSRPDLIERASTSFPPDSFEDPQLSIIAAAAYKTYEEHGSLSSDDIINKDEKLRARLLQVFEYGANHGERDYEKLLNKWIATREPQKLRAQLRERARQGDDSALAQLKEVYERRQRAKH